MRPTITRADQLKPKPDESNLGFGIHFTDHMFNMDYTPDKGWHNPRIEPYAFIENGSGLYGASLRAGCIRGS